MDVENQHWLSALRVYILPDLGEIIINGKTYRALTPVQAMQEGIQVIYQDLSLFQHLNVAENIAIGRLKTESKKLINWKYVKTIAEEQFKENRCFIGVRSKNRRAFYG